MKQKSAWLAALAAERINTAGGVLGRQIVLVSEDDENSPALTAGAFERLAREGVNMIVGSSTSWATMAIAERAQSAGVLLITLTATRAEITRAGDFVFRASFIDSLQGIIAANFAFNYLELRRAAVLFAADNDFSASIAEAFRERFAELGGEVAAWESYLSSTVDFSAQVCSIRAADPDLVFLPNFFLDVALQAEQLRAQGVGAVLLGADGWDGITGSIAPGAGDEIAGGFWLAPFAADTARPRGAEFARAFEARFSRPASMFAALGYDSMMLLAAAISAAGSFCAAEASAALARVDGEFAAGRIRFDENRNPVRSAAILEIVRMPDGSLASVYKTTAGP